MRNLVMTIAAVGAAIVASSVGAAAQSPRADPAAVDRGRPLFGSECGFCHGSNARGGSNGPDLTRSIVVQEDENGHQLGEFVRAGRPDRGMPKFELSDAQVADIAAFLHGEIRAAADRNAYKILDILVGDPKAGAAFFAGAGRCVQCHKADGDLKGIGGRYDPATLQARMLVPRGVRPAGSGPPLPAYRDPNAVKATITLPDGRSVTGAVVRVTDFEASIYVRETGAIQSFLRDGDQPRVVVTDPLQAHIDLLLKWTDADMHNATAYLASLK